MDKIKIKIFNHIETYLNHKKKSLNSLNSYKQYNVKDHTVKTKIQNIKPKNKLLFFMVALHNHLL